MGKVLTAVLLAGQWHVTGASLPDYVGIVLIDPEGRVTWDSPVDGGRPARQRGYIVTIEGTRVDIALTDRVAVVHLNCKSVTSDELHCVTLWKDGSVSAPYVLTRKAAGPKKLMPVIQ